MSGKLCVLKPNPKCYALLGSSESSKVMFTKFEIYFVFFQLYILSKFFTPNILYGFPLIKESRAFESPLQIINISFVLFLILLLISKLIGRK